MQSKEESLSKVPAWMEGLQGRVTRGRKQALGIVEDIAPKESNPLYDNIERPFLKYDGKINYHLSFNECAEVCDSMLNRIPSGNDNLVLGFDMEWPFSFQTGPGKSALVQMCADLDEVYLFQVSEFNNKIPAALISLLSHPNVKITGVNIRNDVHKLNRDFPIFDKEPVLLNCIDARTQAKEVLPFNCTWSMEKLILYCFKLQISKEGKVRRSKWHVAPLSKEQQIYAATDAYASLMLYNFFRDRKLEQITKDILDNMHIYAIRKELDVPSIEEDKDKDDKENKASNN